MSTADPDAASPDVRHRPGARGARAQAGVADRARAGAARGQRGAAARSRRGERAQPGARRSAWPRRRDGSTRCSRACRRRPNDDSSSAARVASARSDTPQRDTVTLDVSLLGRDYKVACKEAERAELNDAVALLDRRMREIREAARSPASERIAVMAALNLAHDLLRERRIARAPPRRRRVRPPISAVGRR